MMRQMRENTKWIMLITAVAFVLLMVFEWGMDMTGQSSTQFSGGEIGQVAGEPVMYQEYQAVYNNIYQQQQSQIDGPITSLVNRQIEDAAWEQVVMQRLLQKELRERGIQVSDEEIREAAMSAPPPELMSEPAFQTDGQFDMAKYRQFLASPALDQTFLFQLEAYYRDMIPRSKLYFQNSAGLYVSDGQLWRMYRDANETATVRFLAFDPEAMVPASEVTVPENDLREYYEENQDDFVRPAQVNVRYVTMNRAPSARDSADARELAGTYRSQIAGGEPFQEVALRAAAADEPTRESGLQFSVGRGQLPPALDQAIFSTAAGQLSQPVLTAQGYHVIQVVSRDGESADVRQLVVPLELSRETEDRLLDRADSLDDAAARASLEQAAAPMGLEVRTSEVTSALPVLPGIGAIEEGFDWALDEAEVGEVSEVFETESAFYVLELISRREEGVLSLEAASPTIRELLLRRARIDRAREMLADAVKRARAGESLDQIGAATGAEVQQAGPFTRGEFVPGLGQVNAAIGAAFSLEQGEISPLLEADNRLFLLEGVSRDLASRDEWQAQVEQQRAQVLQAMADSRWNQFMSALRENAEVVDNRRAVFNAAAQQQGAF